MFIFNVAVTNTFFFLILSFLSFLCCNCQQAVEDLLEDEEEDFDKDDKVIMSRVRDAVTYNRSTNTCMHTAPGTGLTLLHTAETQTDEWIDTISPATSHRLICTLIPPAWGANMSTKIVQPFNLFAKFSL